MGVGLPGSRPCPWHSLAIHLIYSVYSLWVFLIFIGFLS